MLCLFMQWDLQSHDLLPTIEKQLDGNLSNCGDQHQRTYSATDMGYVLQPWLIGNEGNNLIFICSLLWLSIGSDLGEKRGIIFLFCHM